MRYPASEQLETITIVEQSRLPARHTFDQLGVARRTFYRWHERYNSKAGRRHWKTAHLRQAAYGTASTEDIQQHIVEMALEHSELSPRELAVRFTDERRYFVSEATVCRLLKAHDPVISPAYQVIKTTEAFHTQI